MPNAWKQSGVCRCLIALLLACAAACPATEVGAQPTDIPGPPGSHAFGTAVAVLPNGNFVVTDPYAQSGPMNVGRVFLYRSDGTLINFFSGSAADDRVGSGGITVLANGDFVISSPYWSNDGVVGAGAVTWVDGSNGLSGLVSASNSLVGSAANDHVGADANGYAFITALPGGNYVVPSSNWNNAAGAVTWANGGTGLSGAVSPANSLVGTTAGDKVGALGITVLTNGNYVVASQSWNGGAGALTWVNGASGLSGAVSAENSLVGSADSVVGNGYGGMTALSNGNYVVASPGWNGGRGAVTWGNGATGVHGFVSASNSLVGSAPNDAVGNTGITALTNGNYVVSSEYWASKAGAATWVDGTTGLIGEVSATNSLVGTQAGDEVGYTYALSNGNYVVVSSSWSRGTSVGAVTWGDGSNGTTGAVSLDNSLVGNEVPPQYGYVSINVVPLSNGNYVVVRPGWNNGAATSAGAVTWADGTKGISGAISPANSLVGSVSGDRVGDSGYPSYGLTALTNGNYVVLSPWWSNGTAAGVGAVTWANGRTGLAGEISAANSLVGLYPNDHVGNRGATALRNGNYVISSVWSLTVPQQLGYSVTPGIGAATWGNGITGLTGSIGVANSLIGSHSGDDVGDQVIALSSGDYAVVSPFWANGNAKGAGAVTWADGGNGLSGVVSAANSLVGSTTDDTIGSTHFGWFDNPSYFFGVTALSGGSYAVLSPDWQNGQTGGAVSLGSRGGTPIGPVSTSNSAQGRVTFQTFQDYAPAYDSARDQLIVGFAESNKVSIIKGSNSTVSTLNVNQHGLTGSWYNAATGGQGIEMEMYPDLAGPGNGVLFAGWFTFDVTVAGGQRWYALQGTSNGTTTITLDIATGYGGNFAAPPAVTGTIFGQAAIRFIDCSNATLTYNFSDGSGRTGTIPLTRLTANVTCTTSCDSGPAPADYLLSGSWFDSITSGQGLIFDVNPVQPYLFAAWYTFAPDGAQTGGPGSQRWYTLQTGQLPNGTTALNGIGIYTATGGVFNDPTATATNQVGTASITFSSCNAMTLNYTFTSGDNQGRSGTMHLTRTGPTPAGCSL